MLSSAPSWRFPGIKEDKTHKLNNNKEMKEGEKKRGDYFSTIQLENSFHFTQTSM